MSITLEVLRTGPLALVEDLGRPGMAHMGVTRSGAADRRAHTLANRLVANPGERATVEVTFGGFSARVRGGGGWTTAQKCGDLMGARGGSEEAVGVGRGDPGPGHLPPDGPTER